MSDALGNTPSIQSTDPNAAAELASLLLSTDANGAISQWAFTTQTSTTNLGMSNPTFLGGSGFPVADSIVGDGGNSVPGGWNLGNSATGVWTETLDGFQGGSALAPVYLLSGSPIAGLGGSISGVGAEEYYGFFWYGGAFSASAFVAGADPGSAFTYSLGSVTGCNSTASQTLSSADRFSGNLSVANLAPGQYCIGLTETNGGDPNYSITFNTPVTGAPEPSTPYLIAAGLSLFALRRLRKN